jgi:histidinol-phosphate aminotransferase
MVRSMPLILEGMYTVCANVNDVAIVSVPLSSDFHLNVPEIKRVINSRIKIIFLCSPGNPTGTLLKKEDIISVLEATSGLVVCDEAYIDFCDDDGSASMSNLIHKYPNLLVSQTLSKSFGLAGLRYE